MSGNIIPLPESLTLKKWRQKLADQKEKKCSNKDWKFNQAGRFRLRTYC